MSKPKPRPKLRQITLAAADCIRPDLAARALRISMEKCEFADAVLFSDAVVEGPFRTEVIPKLGSLADYNRFCMQELHKRIATPFVLIVQWDGYVIDADAWRPEFTRYDYIGSLTPGLSPEPDGKIRWFVGNGGFSLRSKRLLDAASTLPLIPGLPEDHIICRTFRQTLERDVGIRFAPEEVANRFSFEQRRPNGPTFGFHGIENLARVSSDDEVVAMFDRLTPAERTDGRLLPPVNECLKDGKLDLAVRLYDQARGDASPATMRTIAARVFKSPEFAAWLIDALEELRPQPAGERSLGARAAGPPLAHGGSNQ